MSSRLNRRLLLAKGKKTNQRVLSSNCQDFQKLSEQKEKKVKEKGMKKLTQSLLKIITCPLDHLFRFRINSLNICNFPALHDSILSRAI